MLVLQISDSLVQEATDLCFTKGQFNIFRGIFNIFSLRCRQYNFVEVIESQSKIKCFWTIASNYVPGFSFNSIDITTLYKLIEQKDIENIV